MTGSSIGYVFLHRKLLQNPIWTQLAPAVLKVAIYFLLRANYEPDVWYDSRRMIPIAAGCFITSYVKTAAACNLSVQQVRDAFGHLERTQFATYRRTRDWTLVSVINWTTYQATPEDENMPENTGENSPRNRPESAIGTPSKEIKNRRTKTSAFPGVNARSRNSLSAEQERWFSIWWPEYRLHKAKKAARDAFRKHVRTEARFKRVIAATRAQRPEMLRREPSKRPHGATWLNGERWEDELAITQPTTCQDDYPEFPR